MFDSGDESRELIAAPPCLPVAPQTSIEIGEETIVLRCGE
jgi:hypothetical protein